MAQVLKTETTLNDTVEFSLKEIMKVGLAEFFHFILWQCTGSCSAYDLLFTKNDHKEVALICCGNTK